MLESIFLGIAQGIGEWLPISSEGVITLLKANFFGDTHVLQIIDEALFLHLGTALAAIIFFWRDIWTLIKDLFRWNEAGEENRKTILFLVFSTLISGGVGLLLLQLIPENTLSTISAQLITILVGIMLLVTAFIQIAKVRNYGNDSKHGTDLNIKDGLIVSLAQAIAVIPGLSRSGLTVGSFLLLGYSKRDSLRLSFLMSIPVVLVGNVVLNLDKFVYFDSLSFVGLLSALIFGLLTIGVLMKLAEKINFGYFVLLFAALTLIASIFL